MTNWLHTFRVSKRQTPMAINLLYNWQRKKMVTSNNTHPFVTVREGMANMIKEDVDSEELDALVKKVCQRSVEDEDRYDRHRVQKFCDQLEEESL